MPLIRVLVVDDSVLVRKLLTDVIDRDPDCEVVGVAPNGKLALAKMPQLAPDVITLDIEMPVMDGLETLKAIRKQGLKLPVIMFSTLTARGAEATLDALSFGASEYVTKPSNTRDMAESIAQIQQQLIPKIKGLVGKSGAAAPAKVAAVPTGAPALPKPRPRLVAPSGRIDIVAIGISTGGPNALSAMMPRLPADLPVPVVMVQHMPPLFTKSLADRLDATCAISVAEAEQGTPLKPGHALIAPGGFHMVVQRVKAHTHVAMNEDSPENHCRPAADVLFRSVAAAYGPHVLAVVMTGMGHDGLQGCEVIHEAGGTIWAQDEATSVVWGMPGYVAKAGLAERVLPLERIGPEIARIVRSRRT